MVHAAIIAEFAEYAAVEPVTKTDFDDLSVKIGAELVNDPVHVILGIRDAARIRIGTGLETVHMRGL